MQTAVGSKEPRVRNTEHVLSWCARLSTLDEWNFDGEKQEGAMEM